MDGYPPSLPANSWISAALDDCRSDRDFMMDLVKKNGMYLCFAFMNRVRNVDYPVAIDAEILKAAI